jgi:hypothetical protein
LKPFNSRDSPAIALLYGLLYFQKGQRWLPQRYLANPSQILLIDSQRNETRGSRRARSTTLSASIRVSSGRWAGLKSRFCAVSVAANLDDGGVNHVR